MFKLSQSQDYTWPVTVNMPQDGGKFAKETFDARFRRVAQERIDELRLQSESGEKMNDSAIVREVLVGWSGITDDGQDLPFSPANLDRLLSLHGVASAIVVAWLESLSGERRKN